MINMLIMNGTEGGGERKGSGEVKISSTSKLELSVGALSDPLARALHLSRRIEMGSWKPEQNWFGFQCSASEVLTKQHSQ